MKQAIVLILTCVLVFCTFSCTGVDPARRYPQMVADMPPVAAGTFEAQLDRLFSSSINKVEIQAIFYPRLNSVAIEFRFENITYRQFWDAVARLHFSAALERYKQDYAARNLQNQYSKTRGIYGRTRGRVEWETFRFSQTYVAYPTIEVGYRFRGESPYFATFMRSAKAEENSGASQNMESRQINMYFTRGQADELVKLFDQAYLMGLLGMRGVPSDDLLTEDDYYSETEELPDEEDAHEDTDEVLIIDDDQT